jgi:hypothetical protein
MKQEITEETEIATASLPSLVSPQDPESISHLGVAGEQSVVGHLGPLESTGGQAASGTKPPVAHPIMKCSRFVISCFLDFVSTTVATANQSGSAIFVMRASE